MQVATLYPNRLTITPLREKKSLFELTTDKIKRYNAGLNNTTYIENFKKKKNPFLLSQSSKKKLMDSINTMYALSKPRKIKMKSGKYLFNFQLAFVTLTLPSKQMHSDVFIKKECINQLLVELKRKYQIENYVWKAELQKNKNIHFHFVFDKYIDFQALRRIWNRILEKFGYVSNYANKMNKLSLLNYHKLRNKNNVCSFEVSKKAYIQGKKSNWSNPNSVDVRQVRSKKDFAIYLAKYISKDDNDLNEYYSNNDNLSDDDKVFLERMYNFGRSWSRSYSLARVRYQNKFLVNEIKKLINYFIENPGIVKRYKGDFYEVFYFNINDLKNVFKKGILKYLFNNAMQYNYIPPV